MVFITGGTGLVGSYLLLELAKRGAKVRAHRRSELSSLGTKSFFERSNSSELFEEIEWVMGDLTDVLFLESALRGIKTIYHLAAIISFDSKDEKRMIDFNVGVTEKLVNEAIAQNITEFIFLSSISALDEVKPNGFIEDNSNWDNEKEHGGYALSKYRSEMHVWRGSQEGLKVLILCPSIIIGSLDGKRESEKIFRIALRKKAFATEGITGFVDVRDVVEVIFKLVENGKFNEKYIVNAENVSYHQVIRYLRQLTGKPDPKVFSRKQLIKVYYFTKMFGWLIGKRLSKANIHSLTSASKYSSEKIIRDSGHIFIPVEQSLKCHLERFEENRR